MVIEIYKRGPEAVYDRASTKGRMLPDGLDYVDSWLEAGKLDRCFQLMQTEDPASLRSGVNVGPISSISRSCRS